MKDCSLCLEGKGAFAVDMTKKIKMAEAYAGIKEAELARKLGKSSQALGQRVKTGKFSIEELEELAIAMGAKFVCYFEFPDGERV